ncbi:MAG: hypothetical protein EOO68_17325 [Moraxellaceae bacterium]|nr:MAG: hypothetical protein EOO68_17325 [Moraxellaceae bacterium]
MYQLILEANTEAALTARHDRRYYVHLIEGELTVKSNTGDWETLTPGDGAKLEELTGLTFAAKDSNTKALVFDLP